MFKRFLLSSTGFVFVPPGLCFSDAGANADGAGAGGGAAADPAANVAAFLAQVPEDIRTEAAFKDIKDVGSLARSYLNGQKLIGKVGNPDAIVVLPGPNDDWGPVFNRLGRPESADKYALTDPKADDIPAGFSLSAEAKTAFAGKAHELGLSQKQADALYSYLNGARIAAFKGVSDGEQTALREVDAGLRRELGAAYDQAAERGNVALAHLDTTLALNGGLKTAVQAMPAAARAPLFKALAEVGKLFEEHKVIGGGNGGGMGNALSPAEAQQQIDAKRGDPVFSAAYMNKSAPGHNDAVAEMARLYEMANPPQQAA